MTPCTRPSSDELALRLAGCLPGATFELEQLVRLIDVVATTDIDTAAVSCGGRARLLVNPDFVAEHCQRDEHLFLLVMHELWHVLLAHTTLYPRPTPAHNVAFDAIINAGLARQFPGPAYRGFLEALNPPDEFPARLLRPPRGWPDQPVYDGPGPKRTAALLARLYPRPGEDTTEPSYAELLRLLLQAGTTGDPFGDGTSSDEGASAATLLGHHDDEHADTTAMADPLFGDVVRGIVATWPPPPFPIAGRDTGGPNGDHWITPLPEGEQVRRAVETVLRSACRPHRHGERHRTQVVEPVPIRTVLPSPRDRHRAARQRLGLPTLLWSRQLPVPRTRVEPPARANVYLDVSGSMLDLLPHLLGPLARYVERGLAAAWQFSTSVEPLLLDQLRHGQLITTYGTDINGVLEHAAADPTTTRIVVITDGYVGAPTRRLLTLMTERGIGIDAVLPSNGWACDLAPHAHLHHLPPLNPRETR